MLPLYPNMSSVYSFLGVLGLVLILGGCAKPIAYNWRDNSKICARLSGKNYTLEVAHTPAARSKGLSKRSHLTANTGMIFVFDKPSTHRFWMKDTFIPLELIWFDTNYSAIAQQTLMVENDPTNPQNNYESPQPAQYAIEINADELEVPTGTLLNITSNKECGA